MTDAKTWKSVSASIVPVMMPIKTMNRPFGLALIFIGLAVLIRYWFGFFAPGLPPYITLFPAIVAAGVVCGTLPAVMAVAVGVIIADFLWLAPTGSLWIGSFDDVLSTLLFLLACAFILSTTHRLRRAFNQADAERDRRQAYFDAAGILLIVIDRSGIVREINRHAIERLGYREAAEIIGRNWVDTFVAEKDRAGVARLFASFGLTGRPECSESHLARQDGADRLIAWNYVLLPPTSGQAAIIASGQDITDQRRTELESRRNEATLSAVLRQIPAAVVILEPPDGTVMLRSDRSAEILGHPLNMLTIAGLGAYGGVHSDGRPYRPEEYPVARALRAGEVVEAEPLAYLRPDGTTVSLQVYAAPVRDAEGNILAAVGMAFDVSHQTRAEAELREALETRELLFREADHRIKNSLQLVVGMLSLQRQSLDDPDAAQTLESAIARVSAIAETHLALQQSDDFRTIMLGDLVTQLCKGLSKLNPSVELHCTSEPHLRLESERAVSLGLIVSELITNALLHAYPGGRQGQIHFRAVSSDGLLLATVADDGVGMPADNQRRGLGTKVIRSLVAQLRAEITTETAAGQGTTVTVAIPGALSPPG